MKILLTTIITIVILALTSIFIIGGVQANPYTKTLDENNQSTEMFGRLFQRHLPCSDSDFAHNDLTDRLQLKKVWWGLSTEQDLAELYVHQYKGMWVLLLSKPDNKSCGLIGGEMSIPYDTNPYFK